MTTHPAIDNNKVKSILNDPYEPSPKIMAIKYIREVTGWLLSESKEWLDNFISTLQSQTGTITWHNIAEGHLPPKTNDSTNGNLILYSKPLDQFTRGFYRHDIDMWGHNSGNWQPTHFAYINYPE